MTQFSGKINLIILFSVLKQVLSAGTLIDFSRRKVNGDIYVTNDIEILMIPINDVKKNIYWIHHFLEICYYFLPLELPCKDVFQILKEFFRISKKELFFKPYFSLVKKICMIKLFKLLGFYPEREFSLYDTLFENILAVSIDSSDIQKVRSLNILLSKITSFMVKEIDLWLFECLNNHPYLHLFKTISFFDEI